MAAGGDVPHDLATFVIEQSLGFEHGFWGCVADGATFKSLGRKRTERGRAVIQRHLFELQRAEAQVNEIYFAWRQGVPTPADDVLNRAKAEWRGLPEGGSLVRHWAAVVDRPRRRRQL
jgi:hypothetical protein